MPSPPRSTPMPKAGPSSSRPKPEPTASPPCSSARPPHCCPPPRAARIPHASPPEEPVRAAAPAESRPGELRPTDRAFQLTGHCLLMVAGVSPVEHRGAAVDGGDVGEGVAVDGPAGRPGTGRGGRARAATAACGSGPCCPAGAAMRPARRLLLANPSGHAGSHTGMVAAGGSSGLGVGRWAGWVGGSGNCRRRVPPGYPRPVEDQRHGGSE